MTPSDQPQHDDPTPTVLVIDDELGPRESLRFLLKNDCRVICADTVDHGLEHLRSINPDVVIMDIRMPGRNGIDGLREIRRQDPDLSVIMLTGFAAVGTAQDSLRNEASDYIEKPFDAREMHSAVLKHVERTRTRRRQRRLLEDAKVMQCRILEMQQKDHLAELGQFSAEFVHDLRNALAMIKGSSDLLRMEMESQPSTSDPSAKGIGYLGMLERSMQQCFGMLNSWQHLIHQDPAHLTPLDLNELIGTCVGNCQPAALAAHAQLTFEPLSGMAGVLGDGVQLTRAAANLIQNALHALPATDGQVRVRLEKQGGDVRLIVSDNGCGIPPENLKHLFTPNFTTKRTHGGMGLGLFITRKVAETHGGRLTVDSVVNQGTTFTLSLPVAARLTNPAAV